MQEGTVHGTTVSRLSMIILSHYGTRARIGCCSSSTVLSTTISPWMGSIFARGNQSGGNPRSRGRRWTSVRKLFQLLNRYLSNTAFNIFLQYICYLFSNYYVPVDICLIKLLLLHLFVYTTILFMMLWHTTGWNQMSMMIIKKSSTKKKEDTTFDCCKRLEDIVMELWSLRHSC